MRTGGYPLLSNKFTLIELLAVIVILAIIALIAIPRIADIIDNSEESATLAGGRNYLRAVEQAILNKNLKEKFNPSECEIQSDGNLVCDGKLLEIEMTGNKPSEGTITIEKKVPSNAIDSWNVSAAKDNSVIAWYTDVDNNGLYELYIGGDGGVKANPNS